MPAPWPNELWLETLQYIPRSSLFAVSSVSHKLRALALPLICVILKTPVHETGYAELERLKNLMSSPFGKLYRACVARLGGPALPLFWNRRDRLHNLSLLTLDRVPIDRMAFDTLHRLLRLRELTAVGCLLKDNVYLKPLPLLRLSRLDITDSSIDRPRCFYSTWIHAVETLLELRMSSTHYYDDVVAALGASNLHQLHKLTVGLGFGEQRDPPLLSPSALPALKEFHGQEQFAGALLQVIDHPIKKLGLTLAEQQPLFSNLDATD
ncbi:hypothetical protein C8F01DRAFT_1266931 [Mycena amicta]|nr:hypothetical protein C8F01DRAFT_1266931 [Mycena amicta]